MRNGVTGMNTLAGALGDVAVLEALRAGRGARCADAATAVAEMARQITRAAVATEQLPEELSPAPRRRQRAIEDASF